MLKLCFRTHSLFSYTFSSSFFNVRTFCMEYLCFRTGLWRAACFRTVGLLICKLSNMFESWNYVLSEITSWLTPFRIDLEIFVRFRTEDIVIISFSVFYLGFRTHLWRVAGFIQLVSSHKPFRIGLIVETMLPYKRHLPLYCFVKIFKCLYVFLQNICDFEPACDALHVVLQLVSSYISFRKMCELK